MSESLPEISRIKSLLVELGEGASPANAKKAAAPLIAMHFGRLSDIDDQFAAMAALSSAISSLPDLIHEQFSEGGRREAAMAIVDRLKRVFSPRNIALNFEGFIASTTADRSFVEATIPLLEDIRFDSSALGGKAPDIIAEVNELRAKVLQSEGLSHASKVVIDAQLSLMERSLVRFGETGVGPFRETIFSSMGRIVVELKRNPNNDKVVVRDTLDDILRIYGLFEIGGDLLSLAAPVAMKLLAAPV